MEIKPRNLVVLIDMDDTITDLLGAWVEMLNNRHGTSVDPADVQQWDVVKSFPTLTSEQVFAPLLCDSLWSYVHPKDGAVETVRQIMKDGHKVYIVTTSAYETLREKMDTVLFRYFPFLSWGNVIITTNKQMIKGDVLIDDGVHNLVGGEYEKILVDAPHNKSIDAESYGMVRVKTWNEIYKEICRIAKEKAGV